MPSTSEPAAPSTPTMPVDGPRRPGAALGASALIAGATVAAFWPIVGNGFLTWGDRADLVTNEHFRGLSAANLRWMATASQAGHYQPLSWLTFAVDWSLWGMDPRGFHLTSVLLHAACAVAVFFLLLELVRAAGIASPALRAAAVVGTLVFALHPLRVETVAWATERRGALSGVLLVLAVLAYLRWARARPAVGLADRRYVTAVVLFGLSLLAKEVGFVLPVVLLVLDAYPLRRWRGWRATWPLVAEKVPFVVLSVAIAVVAGRDAATSGYNRSLADYSVGQRVAQCFYGLGFYLEKTVLPVGLSPLYPIPPHLDPLAPRFVASAMAVTIFTLGLVAVARRTPAPLVAWLCAVVLLAPVLGVVQAGLQIAADRYTYVPAIALSAAVAGGLARAWADPRTLRWSAPVALLVLVALAAGTWRQAHVWRTSETLWRQAVAVDPTNVFAHNDLGSALVEENRPEEAAAEFERAVAINPGMIDAQFNLAVLRAQAGRIDEAIEHLQIVVAVHPQDVQAREFLERALAVRGR